MPCRYSSFLMKFTSHYVSINSNSITTLNIQMYNLHPTMYLLIQQPDRKRICRYQNLHPTMYLLIPDQGTQAAIKKLYLHPTMYLLIPSALLDKGAVLKIYIPLCIY